MQEKVEKIQDFLEEGRNELTSNLGSGVHKWKGPCSLFICIPGPGPKFNIEQMGQDYREPEVWETSEGCSTQNKISHLL